VTHREERSLRQVKERSRSKLEGTIEIKRTRGEGKIKYWGGKAGREGKRLQGEREDMEFSCSLKWSSPGDV